MHIRCSKSLLKLYIYTGADVLTLYIERKLTLRDEVQEDLLVLTGSLKLTTHLCVWTVTLSNNVKWTIWYYYYEFIYDYDYSRKLFTFNLLKWIFFGISLTLITRFCVYHRERGKRSSNFFPDWKFWVWFWNKQNKLHYWWGFFFCSFSFLERS